MCIRDRLCTLEYDLFCEIRDRIAGEIERIQTTAKAVARLDVFCSFSLVAEQNHYVRPVLNEKGQINIKDGRHPVVEKMIEHDMFIPNDTYLDNNSHQIAVITGPNMACLLYTSSSRAGRMPLIPTPPLRKASALLLQNAAPAPMPSS